MDYLKDEKWDYYPSDMTPYKTLLMEERDLLVKNITNLQEENDRLSTELLKYDELLLKRNCQITKAINYINENKRLSMFADCREPEEDWFYDLECSANDLLDILQGDK